MFCFANITFVCVIKPALKIEINLGAVSARLECKNKKNNKFKIQQYFPFYMHWGDTQVASTQFFRKHNI